MFRNGWGMGKDNLFVVLTSVDQLAGEFTIRLIDFHDEVREMVEINLAQIPGHRPAIVVV